MKIALISDIHSNLEALQACLAHADRAGAGMYVFLGDLVGYGADPVACLSLLADYADKGALLVLGNHDEAALGGLCMNMSSFAREATYWTRAQLGDKERAFLSSLPLTRRHNDLLLVHASAETPGDWLYIESQQRAQRCMDATDAAVTFVGHVHSQILYWRPVSAAGTVTGAAGTHAFVPTAGVPIPLTSRRRWLAIVGSAGQPRDGYNTAAYAMFDDAARTLSFRVPYDHVTTARKIIDAGLPEWLAWRLHRGVRNRGISPGRKSPGIG